MLFYQSPHEPHVGDILLYRLRSEDLPKNPAQIWHGLIKHIWVDIADRAQARYYVVQSIEHPDCEELIYPTQVAGYEMRQSA